MQAALMATPDETEAQFYECLQRGELERLMTLWADEDEIACVHPGGPRLIGLLAIRAAFEEIFGQGPIDVRPAQVRRITMGNCAVHHVLEEVRVQTDDGPRNGYVLCTNVYQKTPLGWRLVVHHASPGTPRELQEFSDGGTTLH
ncbi:MAG: nuclear transport factor 2 family protein [Leptothrix sp. (in: b-proteobacteria)]